MTWLIDADVFVKQLEDYIEHAESVDFQMAVIGVVNDLKKQPTVDAEPVRHGKWKPVSEDWRHQIEWWKCSECGFATYTDYTYCPQCGAKMDGEQEKQNEIISMVAETEKASSEKV